MVVVDYYLPYKLFQYHGDWWHQSGKPIKAKFPFDFGLISTVGFITPSGLTRTVYIRCAIKYWNNYLLGASWK